MLYSVKKNFLVWPVIGVSKNLYFPWFENTTLFPLVKKLCRKDFHFFMNENSSIWELASRMALPVSKIEIPKEELDKSISDFKKIWESTELPCNFSVESRGHLRLLLENSVIQLAHFDHISNENNISALVQGADCLAHQRPVVELARNKGIPSLCVAHGSYFEVTPFVVAGEMRHVYSDTIAVFGQKDKDILIEHGNNPESIEVTGNPYWDILYTDKIRISKAEARNILNIPKDKKVILLFSTHTEPTWNWPDWLRKQEDCANEIMDQCKKLDTLLLIRPHPLEVSPRANPGILNRVVGEFLQEMKRMGVQAQVEIFARNVSVRAADVCVFSISSSAMTECMILERPVILYGPTPGCPDNYIDWMPSMNDLDMALEAPEGLLERQNDILPYWNHGNDGKASERIVDLVGRITGG